MKNKYFILLILSCFQLIAIKESDFTCVDRENNFGEPGILVRWNKNTYAKASHEKEEIGSLDFLYVAPELRKKGIGSALLRRVCSEMYRRQYRRLELEVIPDVLTKTSILQTTEFYEKFGAKKIEEEALGIPKMSIDLPLKPFNGE